MEDAVNSYSEELESAIRAKATGEIKATAQVIRGKVVGYQVISKAKPPARPNHDETDRHFG